MCYSYICQIYICERYIAQAKVAKANVANTKLAEAIFAEARFAKATFVEAEFAKATLARATLVEARSSNAKFIILNHAHFQIVSCWDHTFSYLYMYICGRRAGFWRRQRTRNSHTKATQTKNHHNTTTNQPQNKYKVPSGHILKFKVNRQTKHQNMD